MLTCLFLSALMSLPRDMGVSTSPFGGLQVAAECSAD